MYLCKGKPKMKGTQEGGCFQLGLRFWIQIKRGKACWVLEKCMQYQIYAIVKCEGICLFESLLGGELDCVN